MGTVGRNSNGQAQTRKTRRDGWTADKETRFIDHLTINCNVQAACREVEMSVTNAYKRRRDDAGFRARWSTAISEAVERLETMMLERAMTGKAVKRTARDGSVTETIEYPDHIALALIRVHKDKAVAHEAVEDEAAVAALRKRIARKLDLICKREEREAQAAGMLTLEHRPTRVGDAGDGETADRSVAKSEAAERRS